MALFLEEVFKNLSFEDWETWSQLSESHKEIKEKTQSKREKEIQEMSFTQILKLDPEILNFFNTKKTIFVKNFLKEKYVENNEILCAPYGPVRAPLCNIKSEYLDSYHIAFNLYRADIYFWAIDTLEAKEPFLEQLKLLLPEDVFEEVKHIGESLFEDLSEEDFEPEFEFTVSFIDYLYLGGLMDRLCYNTTVASANRKFDQRYPSFNEENWLHGGYLVDKFEDEEPLIFDGNDVVRLYSIPA